MKTKVRMKMKLIDADACWDRILNGCCTTEAAVINTPTIDPVHAANACYCKECWYYTEWGECKEFGDIMKPDEFCSRGVIKND